MGRRCAPRQRRRRPHQLREARDLLLGACTSKLTCVECHDPTHRTGPPSCARCPLPIKMYCAQSATLSSRPPTPCEPIPTTIREGRGRAASPATCRRRTSRSTARGPAITASVRRTIRSASCSTARWSARSVMPTRRWRRSPRRWRPGGSAPFERDALRKLYGALDANVILATAERGKPHEQAVAFYVLGETKNKQAIPLLAASSRIRTRWCEATRSEPWTASPAPRCRSTSTAKTSPSKPPPSRGSPRPSAARDRETENLAERDEG